MKIWFFLETMRPPKWGIRAGKKWFSVDRAIIKTQMKTAFQDRQPYCYLQCEGNLTIKNKTAIIE